MRPLLPLAFLALTSLAQAGRYAVTYSGGTGNQWGSSTSPYSFSNGTYGGGGSGASGTITATFTWTRDYPGDTSVPPQTIYVFERCSAGGTSGTGDSIAPSGNDGLGDKPITTTRQLAPTYTQTTVSSSGTRVTKKTGGATTFTVTASPSASGQINAGVSYAAGVTNYAVGIKLSNDPNYYRDFFDNAHQNDRSALTPRQADWGILESDVYAPQGAQPLWLVSPTFVAERIGGWVNPLNEWDAAGQAFRDDLFNEYDSISPWWYINASAFATLPITKTIKLKVTDNGGNGPVSADGTMNFIVHNRYEGWAKGQKGADIYQAHTLNSVESPGFALPPTGSVRCTWTYNPICYDDIQNVVGAMTSIAGNMVPNPILAGFLAAVGAASNQWMPKDDANGCSFQAWGQYLSTIDGQVPASWPATSEQHNYRCYPRLYDIYDNYQYNAGQYGHGGYEGMAHSWVKHRYNGWLVGNFVYVGSGGNATGGGQ